MNKIEVHKPAYAWLFGGMGFHNNEATMYKLMSEEFFRQRVAKTFREIAPTFSLRRPPNSFRAISS